MSKHADQNQQTLFTQSQHAHMEFPTEAYPVIEGVDQPPIGPAVNIHDRAVLLDGALTDLAQANRRAGVQMADNTARGRRSLERQYGDDTDEVVARAGVNKNHLLREAKDKFVRASGLTALIGSGLVDDEQETAMTNAAFGEFVRRYANTDKKDIRNAHRERFRKAHS